MNKDITIVPADYHFEIPEEIAKCPYCETKLHVQVHGWTEEDDGWVADSIEMVCESEPDIDDDAWDDFNESHSEMPYVYLLPVQNTVQEWINNNFRFDMEQ
ncbi:hypothetical protein [Nostoc punctiforme]|uniref:Uncharacterized protein n=2 Tax=Nostoc punctiforme TaxID=272131 RepID=B2ITD6_NOSP7|nr:hypothetical protein [Nostoc punctiforme]ACC81167.1 hypothetical protein Npun_F2613 [Nostoc punctiforme PCC 73102]RCJ41164.1 hypothetical protein A6769_38680 [Nostoc punctiforme NIES-2108]